MAEQESRHDRPKVETSILDPQDYVSAVKRTSWGAVIAGVVAAASVQMLFTALGMAIGLTAARAGMDAGEHASRLGIAAGLWWLITGIISLFVGGWVAGRLSGVIRRRDGGLHGFVTWGATTMLALYLSTTALGDLLGGTAHVAAQARSAGGQPILRGAPVGDSSTGGAADASERASAALREAQQNPEATARKVASYGAGASWWLFLGLLLGGVSSAVGGYLGTPTEPPAPKIRATTVTRE